MIRPQKHPIFDQKDVDGMFEYLEIYRDSLAEDNEIENANKLITYFKNNRKGLLSYQDQGVVLPVHPDGLMYRNMGTMENHIWSIIAKRMKHNHACWSIRGGNNLAKILARKCSGRLDEVSARLKTPLFEKHKTIEIEKAVLSAGQVPQKIGKGYRYPVSGHLKRLENSSGITHQTMLAIVGCCE